MKQSIIDNYNGNDLASFLNHSIQNKTDLDFATGYFNISGFNLLKDSLLPALSDPTRKFRLVIGNEVINEPKYRSYESLSMELEDSKYDEHSKNQVDELIKFLENDNVLVRTNEDRFTHAKCYIFNEHAVVGSSNFTGRGLQTSAELNAVLCQASHVEEVKIWFERIWNKSENTKEKLIAALEASKFGRPVEPHMLFMKMVYEYHQQRLEDNQRVIDSKNLADFQKHAVVHAAGILRKHKGVIVADSTGLGKTHIGIELLKMKVGAEDKKALLIAPKQVLETVWRPRLDNQKFRVKEVSMEKTGSPSFNPEAYVDDIDVIMIDESHNYRSGSTARHKNLMRVLAGGKKKEVILLTATPVNNSLMDLYYQLSLITAGDETYFSKLGIGNLYQHFRRADRKNTTRDTESINTILLSIMIKRTRQSIKDNYKNSYIIVGNTKHPISFPTRKLHKIEYSLTKLLGTTVYEKVLNLIDEINLVPYRIEYYNKKRDEDEKKVAKMRSVLQQTFLMKRFESSIEAIRKSIQTLEKFYTWYEHALNNNKILDGYAFRKLLEEYSDEDDIDEYVFENVKNNKNLICADNYDKIAIRNDLQSDLIKIRAVLKEFKEIGSYADSKLTALHEDFIKNKVFTTGSKKVVIFTSFVDTAVYIADKLKSSLKNEEVFLMTGKTSDREREDILKQFAPKANNATKISEKSQVLVSTDILSEGQNLQDCNYVINYDLPWNPMKIVQRVGRVDRLTSDFEFVTSAVFIPERELDAVLKLLEKLQSKITTIAETVGHEIPIIGEDPRPKDFNAIERIKINDSSLINDLEQSADMIASDKPFDLLLAFMKETGEKPLRAIPMGGRSGKKSSHSGLIILYRNVRTNDMHCVFYDYAKSNFDYVDDIWWIFSNSACSQQEELSMPFAEKETFHQIGIVNRLAKQVILNNLNVSSDAQNFQDVGSKKQKQIRNVIEKAFQDNLLSRTYVGDVHKVLSKKNLGPWNDKLDDFLFEYKNTTDVKQLIMNLKLMIKKYKISIDTATRVERILEEDLRIVACMFLNGPKMQNSNLLLTS